MGWPGPRSAWVEPPLGSVKRSLLSIITSLMVEDSEKARECTNFSNDDSENVSTHVYLAFKMAEVHGIAEKAELLQAELNALVSGARKTRPGPPHIMTP